MGKPNGLNATREIKSHSDKNKAPTKNVNGQKPFLVTGINFLAQNGTTRPTNPIGPTRQTIVAVRKAQIVKSTNFVLLEFKRIESAFSSPNNSIFQDEEPNQSVSSPREEKERAK